MKQPWLAERRVWDSKVPVVIRYSSVALWVMTIFFVLFLCHRVQDYPKSLGGDASVGFTSVDPWVCFSPCKNNTADAAKAQVRRTDAIEKLSGEGLTVG